MYAHIIPLLRTPIGVDGFDYRIPPDLILEPGMLVIVPFRKKQIIGLVANIMDTSAFSKKASDVISRYTEIRFPLGALDLLSWLSLTTFSSKPTVLKTWLRQLPKKPAKEERKAQDKTPSPLPPTQEIEWTLDPRTKLIETAQASQGRTLIITPWKHRALTFHEALIDSHVLLSDMGIRDYFAAWRQFTTNESSTLITTRVGAWLSPFADTILLDEPENDDHKQDDLSPRFDARRIAFWSHHQGYTSLKSFGLTPPIHVDDSAPEIPAKCIPIIRHPKGRSPIFFIEDASLQRLRSYEGPITIIHPIQGDRSRIVCADCDWQAECTRCHFPLSADGRESICRVCKQKTTAPLACPVCQSIDLSKSIPGIETLKKGFAELEPDIHINWRTASAMELEKAFPQHSLILLTSGGFLGSSGSEDIRRNERLAIAYRRLGDTIRTSESTLLIQSPESLASSWKHLLTTEGYEAFRKAERLERKLFQYPPHTRLIKVIVTGTEAQALSQKDALVTRLADFDIQGPFPVAFMPSTRMARFVIHLRPKIEMKERALISTLTPFAKNAIIDLDPIAFFR